MGKPKSPPITQSIITISPATIAKADELDRTSDDDATEALEFATQADLEACIPKLESDTRQSAKRFEFEKPPNSATPSKISAKSSFCSASGVGILSPLDRIAETLCTENHGSRARR